MTKDLNQIYQSNPATSLQPTDLFYLVRWPYTPVSGDFAVQWATILSTILNAIGNDEFLLLSGGTMSGPINMGNNEISELKDPVDTHDAATKNYVDTYFLKISNNLSDLQSASTARTNLGLGSASTHATSDFLQPSNNLSDVSNTATARTNLGLGNISTHSVSEFLQVANNLSDIANAALARNNLGLGTAAVKAASGAGGTLASVSGVIVIGHIAIFSDTSGTVQDGGAITQFLQAANNLSDILSASTARTNLGLGTAATHAATDFLLAANNLSDILSASTARTNLGLGTSATHAATDFLLVANNLSDLGSVGTARTNLGLGTAAIKAASGSGGTVASVTGVIVAGHIAVFADTSGTVQDGGATSQFLAVANNLSDLGSASTARTNLGLGSSATHATSDFLQSANNLSDLGNAATARTNLGVPSGSGTSTGTNTGDQTITLTGDVTGSGAGSFAATIGAHAVTYAKMQQASSATLLGNPTGGTANIQQITLGTNLSFAGSVLNATGFSSPLTTKGDLLGYSTTNARVPAGADNQVLIYDSTQTTGVNAQYPTIPMTNETAPYFWDFLSNGGNANDMSWGQGTSGTGASVTSPTSVTTNGTADGQLAIKCANLNSFAWVAPGQSSSVGFNRYLAGGQIVWETRVTFPTISNSTERYQLQAGLIASSGSTAPLGVYFTYKDDVNSGQWTGNCKDGSGTSTATGGSAVAINTEYRLTFVVNSVASSVSFYVNGTLLGTAVTGNIPTGTALSPFAQITKTVSNTNVSEEADIDYIFYQKQFTTPR